MSEIYYLINRPLSHSSVVVNNFVDDISNKTGLTKMIVKEKLQGTAFSVFQTSGDKEDLTKYLEDLESFKIPAFILSKKDISSAVEPGECRSIKATSGRVTLFDKDNKEITSLDGSKGGFIVLGALNIDRIHSKRASKMTVLKSSALAPTELIKIIMLSIPVMDIY